MCIRDGVVNGDTMQLRRCYYVKELLCVSCSQPHTERKRALEREREKELDIE